MAEEAKKSLLRRSSDRRFATRWFVGKGIDIGAGNDSIGSYRDLFPLMEEVRGWDVADGDAMLMEGISDNTYDFVHSSHCLEHLNDPLIGLAHWIRICKPAGHVVVLVPDEDLYEQGVFPSTFNPDHKYTFTIAKSASWSRRSVNVIDLLSCVKEVASVLKLELLDSTFRYNMGRCDQTLGILGECAIEFVLRKLPADELRSGGRLPPA